MEMSYDFEQLRAAHPDLHLAEHAFLAHLPAAGARTDDVRHWDDLYFAFACAVGHPLAVRAFEQEMDGAGRVLVRYSGTEALARVMIEGADGDRIRAMAEELAGVIRAEVGTA